MKQIPHCTHNFQSKSYYHLVHHLSLLHCSDQMLLHNLHSLQMNLFHSMNIKTLRYLMYSLPFPPSFSCLYFQTQLFLYIKLQKSLYKSRLASLPRFSSMEVIVFYPLLFKLRNINRPMGFWGFGDQNLSSFLWSSRLCQLLRYKLQV